MNTPEAPTLSLAQAPLLAHVPAADRQALREAAIVRSYAAGQTVALEGDTLREALFVGEGLVRLRRLSLEGREHVLGWYGAGSCLNLPSVLDGGPLPASLEAVTDATLLAVPDGRLRALLAGNPAFAADVLLEMAAQNRALSRMAGDLALYSVRARLARFLLEHADNDPPGQRWTQADIAAQIGTVRDVVGRTVRTFADEGLLRREKGRLRIADRDRLEQVAHEA